MTISKKIFLIYSLFLVTFFFVSEAQALTCISCDTIGGTRVDGTSRGPTTRDECENALFTEFTTRGEASRYSEGRIYQFSDEPVSDCTRPIIEEVTGPIICPISPELTFDGHAEISVPGMSDGRSSLTSSVRIGTLDSEKCPLDTAGIGILLMQDSSGEYREIGRGDFEVGPEIVPIASKPLDELLSMLGKREGDTVKTIVAIRFPGIPDYPLWTTDFALIKLNVAANSGFVPPAPAAPFIFEATPPILSIPLPTLPQFSTFMPLTSIGEPGNRYLLIPWIGEYIAAMYKYAIGITGVLAGIMIVIAGLIWLTAGGSAERVTAAKSYIESALVGMVIALTSYILLFAVNPNLVEFGALKIKYIDRASMEQLAIGEGGTWAGETIETPDLPPPPDAQGDTPYKRLMSLCPRNRDSISGYANRINSLEQLFPQFKQITITDHGAAYIRGGFMGRDGCSSNPQPDYAYKILRNTNKPIPPNCTATKQVAEITDAIKESGIFTEEIKDGKITQITNLPTACRDPLKEYYQTYRADEMPAGLICGDCLTFMDTLLKCAAKPRHALGQYGSKGEGMVRCGNGEITACPDPTHPRQKAKRSTDACTIPCSEYLVCGAVGMDEALRQIQAKGGLKFGDMFWKEKNYNNSAGCDVQGHSFMYIEENGRPEIFEMGGQSSGTIEGLGRTSAPGIKDMDDYLASIKRQGDKVKVWIYRPYDY